MLGNAISADGKEGRLSGMNHPHLRDIHTLQSAEVANLTDRDGCSRQTEQHIKG